MTVEGKPSGAIVLEDFNGGDGFYKVNLAYLNKEQIEEIENIVNKWNSEDKELLLKVLLKCLCEMVPYGLICSIYRIDDYGVGWRDEKLSGYFYDGTSYEFYFTETPISVDDISKIKPYLRPMSSMTEEEKEEWHDTFDSVYDLVPGGDPDNEDDYDDNWHEQPGIESYDYLIAHHFDYRGLIPKGLALEAHVDMYKTE